jgi:hypothetical protein
VQGAGLGRATLDHPEHKAARVTVARKGWHIVARIDDVQFARELPESTWKPARKKRRMCWNSTRRSTDDFSRRSGARKAKQ